MWRLIGLADFWLPSAPEQTVLGFVRLGVVDGQAHVEQVSVHPEFSRQGVGAALLSAAERWALGAGYRQMTLTTYREVPWNGPYYDRLGWMAVPDETCGPELSAIRRHEAAAGLDALPRQAMVKALTLGDACDADGVCTMRRVVLLGRGGAGKSTAAKQLSRVLEVPLIELDALFWSAELEPTPPERWEALQEEWAAADSWVMDGDLGPYDVLEPRLRRADAVVVLDFSLARCLWRAARRSRERLDFWWWVITWRRGSRSKLLTAVRAHAPQAQLHVLRGPAQLGRFMADLDAGR